MQLWTKEGNRNVWCQKCKAQSRCNLWICCHDIPWAECSIHRLDPDQHRTIRTSQKIMGTATSMKLLPFQRPEPEPRRAKHARLINSLGSTHKRKSVVQSSHPAFYSTDLSKCPKLRARLARNEQACTELMSSPPQMGESVLPPPHSTHGPSLPGPARVDEDDLLATGASCSVAERVQFFSSAATGAACDRASSSRPVRKWKPYGFPSREKGSASSS